jgi:hypothetical protein
MYIQPYGLELWIWGLTSPAPLHCKLSSRVAFCCAGSAGADAFGSWRVTVVWCRMMCHWPHIGGCSASSALRFKTFQMLTLAESLWNTVVTGHFAYDGTYIACVHVLLNKA